MDLEAGERCSLALAFAGSLSLRILATVRGCLQTTRTSNQRERTYTPTPPPPRHRQQGRVFSLSERKDDYKESFLVLVLLSKTNPCTCLTCEKKKKGTSRSTLSASCLCMFALIRSLSASLG